LLTLFPFLLQLCYERVNDTLKWCSQMKIPEVTLYDPQGNPQRGRTELWLSVSCFPSASSVSFQAG
jgi:hypothetical protein